MSQLQLSIDLKRCTGCAACRIACRIENQLPPEQSWRQIRTYNQERWAGSAVLHYSLACNHCADPPCLHSCPANAYHKDPKTGAVLADPSHCLGCRYCTWVCPFAAGQLVDGVIAKCTLCHDRLQQGLQPACVVACPVQALGIESRAMDQEQSPAAPGFPHSRARPSLRISGPGPDCAAPAMTIPHQAAPKLQPYVPKLISGLTREWSLLVLTFSAACLVGWFSATALLGAHSRWLPAALLLGLAALAISTLHLGRPWRAYRGVLNLRHSWISREVFCLLGFLTLLAALAWPGTPAPIVALLPWPAMLLGWAALIAIDMVYRVPGQEVAAVPHSAMVSLTGVLLVGLLTGNLILVAGAGSLKLVLYLVRKARRMIGPGGAAVRLVSIIRICLGLVIPVIAWSLTELQHPSVICSVLLAELLDRAELYAELRFLDPELQIARDLRSAIGRASTS